MNPQWLELVNAAASGKRPHFFGDADVDRLLAIVWAMAGEMEYIARLLRVLQQELDALRASSAKATGAKDSGV